MSRLKRLVFGNVLKMHLILIGRFEVIIFALDRYSDIQSRDIKTLSSDQKLTRIQTLTLQDFNRVDDLDSYVLSSTSSNRWI